METSFTVIDEKKTIVLSNLWAHKGDVAVDRIMIQASYF